MKHSWLFSSAVAIALIAAPLAVPASAASTMSIGNLEKRQLKFSLHCAGDDAWHTFSLDSLQYRRYSASDWSGTCGQGSYELRIGTVSDDGSVVEKVVPLSAGESYVLAKPGQTNEYIAYNVRSMVVIVNDSSRRLTFAYGCANVSPKSLTVAANDFTWIHVGNPPACSPYQASIETVANDGSKTTLTRPLSLGNLYKLSWNSQRQAWDIQASKQGGGPASNDAN